MAYFNATGTARRVIARLLVWIWLGSLAIYCLAIASPSLANALLSLKISSGLSSSTSLYTPSLMFDLMIDRPIGFALYANELALFGIVSTALYLTVVPSKGTAATRVLLLVVVIGLILSTSRSLVLTYAAVVAIVALTRARKSDNAMLFGVVTRVSLVLAAGASILALYPDIVGTVKSFLNSAAEARIGGSESLREHSYTGGQKIFLENIWTGVGGLPKDGFIQLGSHSLPLSIAVRHGVIGLIALGVIFGLAIWLALWAIYLQHDSSIARMGAAIFLCVIASATIQFDDDMLPLTATVLLITELIRRRKSMNSAELS
ncbi:O-antigen ligase family protein [Gordonia sp. UBA6683]|uniref:O-antigen ligase family protein n=1 Tax=Gordonia sp. UBA6683 TaxID=1946577 RepID=UPI0025C1A20C|nr:O-antigen ligase family protein [Gordonia sp. UBA6683]